MLHLIYGADGYRISQRGQQLFDEIIKAHPNAGIFNFNFADAIAEDPVLAALRGVSLFDPVKAVRIKNLSFSDTGRAILESIDWKMLSDDDKTVVVVEEIGRSDEIQKKLKPIFSVSGINIEPISDLIGIQLTAWIKRGFSERGGAISGPATQRLIMRAGTDSASLIQEIEKLCNFCHDREVTPEDVDLLVVPRGELNIFDLVDACAQKNRARAAEYLYREIATGRDAYQILSAITYQYRNLLIINDLASRGMNQKDMARTAGVHPFVVKKTVEQSRQFKEDELKKAYGLLLAMDTGAKKGMLNLSDELFKFVLR